MFGTKISHLIFYYGVAVSVSSLVFLYFVFTTFSNLNIQRPSQRNSFRENLHSHILLLKRRVGKTTLAASTVTKDGAEAIVFVVTSGIIEGSRANLARSADRVASLLGVLIHNLIDLLILPIEQGKLLLAEELG